MQHFNVRAREMPRVAWFLAKSVFAPRLDRWLGRKLKEQAVLDYVVAHARRGDPQSVLTTMDAFAIRERWMMNVGPSKGRILLDALHEAHARRVLEIGAYCGYSATLIANALPADGALISIEKSRRYGAIASRIVAHAGLSSKHTLLTGTLTQHIDNLGGAFDLVFLDHWKDEYLPDLKRLEARGLLRDGTYVVADNVGLFNVADYLAYVRRNPRYASRFHESTVEYNDRIHDGVEVSVVRS